MSLLDWISPIDKALDLAGEVIEDKDEKNRLSHARSMMKDQLYLAALKTKTVPWVDALHKMGRQITNWVTLGMGFYLLNNNPEITAGQLAAIGGPGALYAWVKGKGN